MDAQRCHLICHCTQQPASIITGNPEHSPEWAWLPTVLISYCSSPHGPSDSSWSFEPAFSSSFFNIYKQANFIQKKAIGKIGIEHKRAADLMSECTPTRAFSMFHPLFAMLSESSDPHVPPAGSFSPFRKGSQSSSSQSPSRLSVLGASAWHLSFKDSRLCQEVRVCLVYVMCSTSKYYIKEEKHKKIMKAVSPQA